MTLLNLAPVKSDISQGSCIALSLFYCIHDITIYLYADDCKIYYFHGKRDNLSAQAEVNTLSKV